MWYNGKQLWTRKSNVQDKIVIHGARAHNLKNIDVEIPRDS